MVLASSGPVKLSLVVGGWLLSMLPLPAAAAAEDQSPAELLSRVMPPPAPAVGFEDRRSLTDFIRRSTKEKDVAVRALGLSSLGRADINGDHCLTDREYGLYLAMWKRWKSSPRAEMVQAIEDYRFVEAKMTDEVTSYTARLLRQSSSVGEMQLLKQRILSADENKNQSVDLDELKRFEEIWKSYLRLPYPAVNAYLETLLGTLHTCVAAPTQKIEIKNDLQPLLRAQESAAEI